MGRIVFKALVWKWLNIFKILLSQGVFESDCPEANFQKITSQIYFEKVTVQKSIVELWTVISSQMIKYLPTFSS